MSSPPLRTLITGSTRTACRPNEVGAAGGGEGATGGEAGGCGEVERRRALAGGLKLVTSLSRRPRFALNGSDMAA